jgi:hypothetical protein
MRKTKDLDEFFLERNGERVKVVSYDLELLSPTSLAYWAGLPASKITLSGMIFLCDRLSSFFYGEGQDLRAKPVPPDLSEVIIEVWHTNDRKLYTFEHSFRLYNVVPGNVHVHVHVGYIDLGFDKIEICEADKRRVTINEDCWLNPEYLKETNESKVILNEK